MAEYHVGCGAFGIYAGTLNSRNKNLWQNKSQVTDEAVCAVAQYLLQEDKSLLFSRNGKKYRLCVQEENYVDPDMYPCRVCDDYDRKRGCLSHGGCGERREEEPEITPCRGCEDYDGEGGCLSNGGCGERREDEE